MVIAIWHTHTEQGDYVDLGPVNPYLQEPDLRVEGRELEDREVSGVRQKKAKRKLRVAADKAQHEPSVYGRAVLKRLAEAVPHPKPRDPRA